jgi:hypothetical protein
LGGIHTCIHTYTQTHTNTHTHTHTHTNKHTHTHTSARNSPDVGQNRAHLDGLGSSKHPQVSAMTPVIVLCDRLLCFRRRPEKRLRDFRTWTSLGPLIHPNHILHGRAKTLEPKPFTSWPCQDTRTQTLYLIPHTPYPIQYTTYNIPLYPMTRYSARATISAHGARSALLLGCKHGCAVHDGHPPIKRRKILLQRQTLNPKP